MELTTEHLEELLSRITSLRIAVLGDFFLDKYLITDPALSEPSIETGLEARQVVEIRCSPGAAGTVTNNLSALGVGTIFAVGVIGEDGQGYDLLRGLQATGVDVSRLASASNRFTPTYTKPMRRTPDGEVELERLDIKNRTPLAKESENHIIESIEALCPHVDAVIVMDQVSERNCGVVTDRVRESVCSLQQRYTNVSFFADSRERIAEYFGVIVKPNQTEAAGIMGRANSALSSAELAQLGLEVAKRNGKPVFLTVGDQGMIACQGEIAEHVGAVPVEGPVDIVGAGDSATAGIVCAMASGATIREAAVMGNLCAGVTVRKLGTTGTASPDEVREAFRQWTVDN